MSTIHIRKAQPDDLRVIQEIAREIIDKSYRPFLGDVLVDWFLSSGEADKELESRMDDCHVLLIDSSIAAFSIYFEDLIHLMMVDVHLHRTGIGSKLLEYCENELFKRGNSTIHVQTFEGNTLAVNFYLKNNWTLVRREEDRDNGFVRVFFEKSHSQSQQPQTFSTLHGI